MKYVYSILFCLLFSYTINAQNEWPMAIGVGGFYNITSLQNTDDQLADQRLDPQMTYGYSANFEHARYFTDNFGWGVMLNYAIHNQNYKGVDTFSKLNYTMYTNATYIRINPLLHYKSFNVYKLFNERGRFVSYIGPYVAMQQGIEENLSAYNVKGELQYASTLRDQTSSFYNSTYKVNYEKPLYKKLDIGGTLAFGYELFFSKARRSSVSLLLRTDIGATNLENSEKQILKDQNGNKIFTDPINPWDGLYAKFWALKAPFDPDPTTQKLYSRARTTNVSYGGGLSFRFYMYPEKRKVTNIFIIR